MLVVFVLVVLFYALLMTSFRKSMDLRGDLLKGTSGYLEGTFGQDYKYTWLISC